MARGQHRVTNAEKGVAIAIHVVPRASKNEVKGRRGDAIKIRLTAPPVQGVANAALIEFLAKRLEVSKRELEIVSGITSRDKLVYVAGLTREEIEQRLALA